MRVSSTDIKDTMLGLWPKAKIMCADRNYWLPSKSDIKDLVWKNYIDEYKYVVQLFDCDDFALVLHAFIVQERYKQAEEHKTPKEQWFPWAFGQVWGKRFKGKKTNHAINICLTQTQEVLLIEPQNDKIWSANSIDDDVYFCRM